MKEKIWFDVGKGGGGCVVFCFYVTANFDIA